MKTEKNVNITCKVHWQYGRNKNITFSSEWTNCFVQEQVEIDISMQYGPTASGRQCLFVTDKVKFTK